MEENDGYKNLLEQKILELDRLIKEKELELKEKELKKRSLTTPLFIALSAGILGLITNIITNYLNSTSNIKLEKQKFEYQLVLKAVGESNDSISKRNIKFFHEMGFLALHDTILQNLEEDKIQFPKFQPPSTQGEKFFKSNCASCHKPEKDMTGPALKGSLVRWKEFSSEENFYAYIKNSRAVINSNDPYAKKLNAQWGGSCPAKDLTNEEIDAIFEYIETY